MTLKLYIFLFVIAVFALSVFSLQVVPERAEVKHFSEKYFNNVTISVKRYGRKSGYYINVIADLKYIANNNLTVHIVFNEFLHNEYRRSFIEFHYKFCDLLNKEPYVGGMLARSGLTCPAHQGIIRLVNMTVPTENFPNVFPFEKGRVDVNFSSTATNEALICIQVVCTFKNK